MRPAGRRHRYYISHRLIARSGEGDLDGWRLPATTLETAVAALIRKQLTSPAGLAKLMKEATPAGIATARNAVADLIDKIDGPSRSKLLAALVESGRIAPGRLMVTLDPKALAKSLCTSPGRIDP